MHFRLAKTTLQLVPRPPSPRFNHTGISLFTLYTEPCYQRFQALGYVTIILNFSFSHEIDGDRCHV